MVEKQSRFQVFLKRKDIEFSARRYGIDALGAMAQGLFASLLVGTILSTLGEQLGITFLVQAGGWAKAATGPAMAVAIGHALHCPPLVLFSLAAVGGAANELGGAGGPLAVLAAAVAAAELGKAVSKETKVDILVTPCVTVLAGTGLAVLCAPAVGAAASAVGGAIMWPPSCSPSTWECWFLSLWAWRLPCLFLRRPSVRHWALRAWQAAQQWQAAVHRWWALP